MDLSGWKTRAIAITALVRDQVDGMPSPDEFFGDGEGRKQMTACPTGCQENGLAAHRYKPSRAGVVVAAGVATLTDRGLRRANPSASPIVIAIEISDDPP